MIDRGRLLSLGYYKKAPSFTGSDKNKCYKIERFREEDSEVDMFKATIWPGPFSSENTPEESKQSKLAPFTEDGLQELVDWMNSLDI
ncbi:hypothetical protein SAMN05421493_12312 [Pseudobutyrivibrio sp. 49]|uniref:hypothetical protein n=1 Tax=unclassified Pseudobutyrivibrio TaxID=2638619 RepID=UPI0008919538|nr:MULTISPECIES: hypothetical protein [unclassified Pseudobutyrivibrio]SDI69878.1 hypothetical protein SAMN05421493_12312 [Pseudobutyrivibrio sp. 49]SFO30913.1 hypothetical protein SAMN04487831_11813 [Pseudobutyrivibrio sp. UC1225]